MSGNTSSLLAAGERYHSSTSSEHGKRIWMRVLRDIQQEDLGPCSTRGWECRFRKSASWEDGRAPQWFRYIEEALQELPANQRIPITGGTTARATEQKTPQESCKRRKRSREETAAEDLPGLRRVQETEAAEVCPTLWAISRGRNGKTAHVVAQATWNIALEEWHTACGWHFARANAKVELTKVVQAAEHQCKKCKEIEELRDGVKGGFRLAQLMKLC